jgi:hypothetical protein
MSIYSRTSEVPNAEKVSAFIFKLYLFERQSKGI